MHILVRSLLVCGTAFWVAPASAQDAGNKPTGVIAVGPAIVAEYEGADDLRIIPSIAGDVRWLGIGFAIRGAQARADVIPDQRFSFGPLIGARLARKNEGGAVGRLREIDAAIEAGAFVGYTLGGKASGEGALQLELALAHDVTSAHDGMVATASATYTAIRRPVGFLSFDVQTSWADRNYTRTYFGVTPAESLSSGLATYTPAAGIKDVGAGVTAGYFFTRTVGVSGRIGANYLVGDAGRSPVTDQGRRWQPGAGLGLLFRF